MIGVGRRQIVRHGVDHACRYLAPRRSVEENRRPTGEFALQCRKLLAAGGHVQVPCPSIIQVVQNSSSFQSVTNMQPGLCVMAIGGRPRQRQLRRHAAGPKDRNLSRRIVTASPKSGCARSAIAQRRRIADMHRRAVHRRVAAVISITRSI